MLCWLETTVMVVVALAGVEVGRRLSRLRSPHWAWGYFIPLLSIALLLAASYVSARAFVPLLACISGSRARFVILCVAVTVGSMTLVGRLHRPFEKFVVLVLMVAVSCWSSILPFLVPALIRNDLSALQTQLDADDICFQTTNYTCAPAAAVTALKRLGFPATEGELAIISHTSPVVGTLPWSLYKALQNHYGQDGLKCELRYFKSVTDLPAGCVTLAVIRDAFLLDHCVAVLDVTAKNVIIGDPVFGRMAMSHKQFERVWRFYGITLQRQLPQSS